MQSPLQKQGKNADSQREIFSVLKTTLQEGVLGSSPKLYTY